MIFESNPTITLQVRVNHSGALALSDTANMTIQLNDLFEGVTDADLGPPPEPAVTAEAMGVTRAPDATTPLRQAMNVMSDGWQEKRIQRLLDPIGIAAEE